MREWRARRGWNALGRHADARRLAQLAAACGAAAMGTAGSPVGMERMRALLDALIRAEQGEAPVWTKGEGR